MNYKKAAGLNLQHVAVVRTEKAEWFYENRVNE